MRTPLLGRRRRTLGLEGPLALELPRATSATVSEPCHRPMKSMTSPRWSTTPSPPGPKAAPKKALGVTEPPSHRHPPAPTSPTSPAHAPEPLTRSPNVDGRHVRFDGPSRVAGRAIPPPNAAGTGRSVLGVLDTRVNAAGQYQSGIWGQNSEFQSIGSDQVLPRGRAARSPDPDWPLASAKPDTIRRGSSLLSSALHAVDSYRVLDLSGAGITRWRISQDCCLTKPACLAGR